jgi:hypothetical protein
MDAFELAAWERYENFNAIETTQSVKVCATKDLPQEERTENGNRKLRLGFRPKHIESGLCVMFHKAQGGTVLEVRGYDENAEEFSYKFFYERDQSCAMRAVSGGGDAAKLNVSADRIGVDILRGTKHLGKADEKTDSA